MLASASNLTRWTSLLPEVPVSYHNCCSSQKLECACFCRTNELHYCTELTPMFPYTQSGIDVANVKMSMNPFCEIAVEVRHASG